MTSSKVDFPQPFRPTRPCLPGPKRRVRSERSGVPSGVVIVAVSSVRVAGMGHHFICGNKGEAVVPDVHVEALLSMGATTGAGQMWGIWVIRAVGSTPQHRAAPIRRHGVVLQHPAQRRTPPQPGRRFRSAHYGQFREMSARPPNRDRHRQSRQRPGSRCRGGTSSCGGTTRQRRGRPVR